MSDFNSRLKALSQTFKDTKPSEGGSRLEAGKYQAKVSRVWLDTVKKGKQSGKCVINIEYSVLVGPQKNRKTRNTYWIESVKDGQSVGFSMLKRDVATLGLDMPETLSTKSMTSLFEKMVDHVVEIAVVENGEFTNVYLNRAVNADAEEAAAEEETEEEEEESEEEEDEDEDDEEESEDEDDEEEEEEEEEPAPKPKGKKSAPVAKPAAGKKKPAAKDDDDDTDWDSLT